MNHTTSLRNAIASLVISSIDEGTGETRNPLLVIKQIVPTELTLITFTLATTVYHGGPGSFQTPVNGIALANNLPLIGVAINAGVAQSFTIYDCNEPRIAKITGTVSNIIGAADLILPSINIFQNAYLTIEHLAYSATA